MILLEAKNIAQIWKNETKQELDSLKISGLREPHLAIIQVGDNPASSIYVKHKMKACAEVGIKTTNYNFSNISEPALIQLVESINYDPLVDGILVQLPLPAPILKRNIIKYINPLKDVDGFHPSNIGALATGHPTFIPATPLGVQFLLKKYNIDIQQKNVVVIGRSNIVGRPLFYLFSNPPNNNTVTLCHRYTKNLPEIASKADILMVAIGKPNFVTQDFVKEGAVVVDVGINRLQIADNQSKIVGDVDFEHVKSKCSAITPVPGGVGLMTVSALLSNTLLAFKRIHGI
ncbi:MAG: bifunctional 5,10-methylenetetrahydrofolate dehydrogenase/5,10-methenyltetrahydrofolate cyclohydrolase [Alphaproteobacteria bacterium]|nr:bifunctional 5,10-methylenetetrahydrofolate dehydrogenase/5,10-methenyltetrahydrofolate cyclohydrolase [Alphaproteobacteria bacterium]